MASRRISILESFLSGGSVGSNFLSSVKATLKASTRIRSRVACAVRYFAVARRLRRRSSRLSCASLLGGRMSVFWYRFAQGAPPTALPAMCESLPMLVIWGMKFPLPGCICLTGVRLVSWMLEIWPLVSKSQGSTMIGRTDSPKIPEDWPQNKCSLHPLPHTRQWLVSRLAIFVTGACIQNGDDGIDDNDGDYSDDDDNVACRDGDDYNVVNYD